MTQTRRTRVKAAIQEIRQFYAIGRSLPRKQSHQVAYGKGEMFTEAKRRRMNEDTARKARQFVDPDIGYTREELNDLCRTIKVVQSAQEDTWPVFRRTYLIRMLSVPKCSRARLQREAITEGWSLAELEREITRRFGTRRHGGRRRRIPRGLAEFLAATETQCESWRRWRAELSRKAKSEEDRHVMLGDLPRPMQTLIVTVSDQVERLRQAAVKELTRLQPGREVRQVFEVE